METPIKEQKLFFITDTKYAGKYVALASFFDKKVVASGDNPDHVMETAHQKGIDSPILIFVPEQNISHVYLCL